MYTRNVNKLKVKNQFYVIYLYELNKYVKEHNVIGDNDFQREYNSLGNEEKAKECEIMRP